MEPLRDLITRLSKTGIVTGQLPMYIVVHYDSYTREFLGTIILSSDWNPENAEKHFINPYIKYVKCFRLV